MYEITGTYLDYELAYRAERMQGLRAPRRTERRQPAVAGFGITRRSRRHTR